MYKDCFFDLRKDIERKKQLVIFAGAGINYSQGHDDISWNALIRHLFNKALVYLSIRQNIDVRTLNIIKEVLEGTRADRSHTGPAEESIHQWQELYQFIANEFPHAMKALIIKEALKNNYTSCIQEFLYSRCNKWILQQSFESYVLNSRVDHLPSRPHHTLYQMARMIILCPLVKAVVSYNYDNFLSQSIKILWEHKERYFTEEERKFLATKRKTFQVKDISGSQYPDELDNDTLFIYHIHGYIPPPSDLMPLRSNEIVLSLDEYYENMRDVYSWQTATQLHFLNHYTCILMGLSLTDMTLQRMLHYVGQSGSETAIYYLNANTIKSNANQDVSSAFHILQKIKNVFNDRYDVKQIYHSGGFEQLYGELGAMISESIKNQ